MCARLGIDQARQPLRPMTVDKLFLPTFLAPTNIQQSDLSILCSGLPSQVRKKISEAEAKVEESGKEATAATRTHVLPCCHFSNNTAHVEPEITLPQNQLPSGVVTLSERAAVQSMIKTGYRYTCDLKRNISALKPIFRYHKTCEPHVSNIIARFQCCLPYTRGGYESHELFSG